MGSKKHNKTTSDKLRSALVGTAGRLARIDQSPDELLGDLFNEVQLRDIYADSKTFVDLVPKKRIRELKREYELARHDPNFVLQEFVQRHFQETSHATIAPLVVDHPEGMSARQHVTWLWPQLTRQVHANSGSLFALPHRYVVPGGRFQEQFYWDTYFIMLGLALDDEWDLMYGMVRNYIFMADKFGYIPTANRTYFVSRSQPPFFADMIELLARKRSPVRLYMETLPTLLNEYSFWMKEKKRADTTWKRVVRMPNGSFLNRYFDNMSTPRPDAHKEDSHTASQAGDKHPEKTFLDLRAAAESGWDFSSRWFEKPDDIHTIRTTDFAPIDLNCILYRTELQIARMYTSLKLPLLAKKFMQKSKLRAEAIREYCWSEQEQWFVDWDAANEKQSSKITLAGVFALYAGVATKQQATAVARHLERDFLKPGGLVTTLVENGQQWDSPNGWAPLQWVAVVGLRKYGFNELADKIRAAWMQTIELVYDSHEKMIEKYDVIEPGKLGGGGEYPLQDGFGWTNGVYAAFYDGFDEILADS